MNKINHMVLLSKLEQSPTQAEREEILNTLFNEYIAALKKLHLCALDGYSYPIEVLARVQVAQMFYDLSRRK